MKSIYKIIRKVAARYYFQTYCFIKGSPAEIEDRFSGQLNVSASLPTQVYILYILFNNCSVRIGT